MAKEGQISCKSTAKSFNYGQRGLLLSKRRKMGLADLHLYRLTLEKLRTEIDSTKRVGRLNKCNEVIYESKLLHWTMIGVMKHDLEPIKLQKVVDKY